jgi:hypothetical protein
MIRDMREAAFCPWVGGHSVNFGVVFMILVVPYIGKYLFSCSRLPVGKYDPAFTTTV